MKGALASRLRADSEAPRLPVVALALAAAALTSLVAVAGSGVAELGPATLLVAIPGAAALTALSVAIIGRPGLALVCLILFVELHLSEVLVRFHGLPSLLRLLALPLLLSALVARPAADRARVLTTPVLLLLGGDAALRLASALWAASPADSIESAQRSAKALILAAAIALLVGSASRLRLAMWTMLGAGTALGSLAIVQTVTGRYDLDFGGLARIKQAQIWGSVFEPRVAGPLGDPNFFAQAILVLIPIGLALGWSSARREAKAAAFAMSGLLLVTVGLTYSRGAVLATAAAVVLSFASHGFRWRRILLVGGLGLVSLLLLPEDLGRRLTSLREIAADREAETLHPDSSFAKRRLLTRTAWEMFLDRPLLGVGAGNYSARFRDYGDRVGSPAPDYDDPAERAFAHSLVLETAAETGVAGLVLAAALFFVAFATAIGAARNLTRRGMGATATLVRSLPPAMAGYLVAGLFLHLQFERHLWLLFGLTAGLATWSGPSEARPGADEEAGA